MNLDILSDLLTSVISSCSCAFPSSARWILNFLMPGISFALFNSAIRSVFCTTNVSETGKVINQVLVNMILQTLLIPRTYRYSWRRFCWEAPRMFLTQFFWYWFPWAGRWSDRRYWCWWRADCQGRSFSCNLSPELEGEAVSVAETNPWRWSCRCSPFSCCCWFRNRDCPNCSWICKIIRRSREINIENDFKIKVR